MDSDRLPSSEASEPGPSAAPAAVPAEITTAMEADYKDSYNIDPARWGKIDDRVQSYWAKKGPESCQNKEADIKASERVYAGEHKRYFSKSFFQRELQNGESVSREWLLYSPSIGSVFCFVCRLYGEGEGGNVNCPFKTTGFSDWKRASDKLPKHENTNCHRKAMLKYIKRASDIGVIDTELRKQLELQYTYWSEVLKRVVTAVTFLSERGLAFRGASEIFGRADNGNYLGILEAIGEHDPFLKSHIEKYGNKGSGTPSYLSSTICEEVIQLMGDRVLSDITTAIKMAKYFSISVDSTPDVSHTDQLTFILRYVSPEGDIHERFVKFLPIQSHTGEALCESVVKVLEEIGIDVNNCRGQCYDNAANMSGVYKGLQARMKVINPLIEWVPCAAHTLNLVGVNSVNCCLETAEFFNFVQHLFNFCSKSTARWAVITAGLQANENKRIETLKSLSETRWSAHAQATKALCRNYANIQDSLKSIADNTNQNPAVRKEALTLHKKMDKLEIAFLCNMWNCILQRFMTTSEALQAVNLDLCNAVDMVRSLRGYVAGLHDNFDVFEAEAKKMSPTVSTLYKGDTQRTITRKKQVDESTTAEVVLTSRDKFRVTVFKAIMDRLNTELKTRYESYETINNTFGFLNKMATLSDQELRDRAAILQKKYSTDLHLDFVEEVVQYKHFIGSDDTSNARELFLSLRKKHTESNFQSFQLFPNVDIALRLYLTLPVTNASGERSFSKLALIKNRLRSTMNQQRLNGLTIMSSESDIVRKLDFTDLIKDFSAKKSRRHSF